MITGGVWLAGSSIGDLLHYGLPQGVNLGLLEVHPHFYGDHHSSANYDNPRRIEVAYSSVARLEWEDVDLAEKVIRHIPPKTKRHN